MMTREKNSRTNCSKEPRYDPASAHLNVLKLFAYCLLSNSKMPATDIHANPSRKVSIMPSFVCRLRCVVVVSFVVTRSLIVHVK